MQYVHNTYWDEIHTLHVFSFVELVFDKFPQAQGYQCMHACGKWHTIGKQDVLCFTKECTSKTSNLVALFNE